MFPVIRHDFEDLKKKIKVISILNMFKAIIIHTKVEFIRMSNPGFNYSPGKAISSFVGIAFI